MTDNADQWSSDDNVRGVAREGAPDRYLAALLAPRPCRAGLVALAALSSEVEKIPLHVREPHLGEIRIQWWRDALKAGAAGQSTGHPVADAVNAALRRHGVAAGHFDDYFDAQVHALYADAPTSDEQLQLALEMTEGVMFTVAARLLGASDGDVARSRETLRHAAEAYGLTRVAVALPYALARGRIPLPPSFAPAHESGDWRPAIASIAALARKHLQHVSIAYHATPRPLQTALLPVALVEPYLRALSVGAHEPHKDIADIAPLTRAWCLAKTHMRRRI